MDEEQNKISLPIAIMLLMIAGTADAFDVLSDALTVVPFIGPGFIVVNWAVGIFSFAIVEFYLIMKGGIGLRKQAAFLIGNLIELIPFLNALPMRTAALLITIYLINKPEITEKIGKVGMVKAKL